MYEEIYKAQPYNNLQGLRWQAGYTQLELAEKAGVNVGVLRHYEQGVKDLNHAHLITLLKLCEALNCKLYDIIEDEEYIRLLKKHV